MMNYLFICIIIITIDSSDLLPAGAVNVLHGFIRISMLVIFIDAYIYEIDTVHRIDSLLFVLSHPYWGYVHTFLEWRFPTVCMLHNMI